MGLLDTIKNIALTFWSFWLQGKQKTIGHHCNVLTFQHINMLFHRIFEILVFYNIAQLIEYIVNDILDIMQWLQTKNLIVSQTVLIIFCGAE